MLPRQGMEAGMRGWLYYEQCLDSFQSSALTCERQFISGTSCSLHIMTQIIGSLMGSLALSFQSAVPFWARGEHRINLCLLGRAVKHEMHPKDILSTSESLSLSLSLSFSLYTGPWRLVLGDSYTYPSHTFSHPHKPPSEPLSVHLHSRLVDKPRITMWYCLLKAHRWLLASISCSSGLCDCIYVIFTTLMLDRMIKIQTLIHSSQVQMIAISATLLVYGSQMWIDLHDAVK